MRPEEYNRRQMQRGALGWEDICRLAEYWQEAHDLEPDGKIGPKTLASLQITPWQGAPARIPSAVGQEILLVAIGEIGKGEECWNNSGEAICKYRGLRWDADSPQRLYGAWCAFFVGWVVQKAHDRVGESEPTWRYSLDNGLRKPVGGAKRLVRRAGKAGRFIARRGVLHEPPIPGDLFSLDRGKQGSWQGHVGIVEDYRHGILHTIEGNVGDFPSKVRRFLRDPERVRLEDIARL